MKYLDARCDINCSRNLWNGKLKLSVKWNLPFNIREADISLAEGAFHGAGISLDAQRQILLKKAHRRCAFFWRRWWDLNPRAAHHGNTISNRARYDHFDTSPNIRPLTQATIILYQQIDNKSRVFVHFLILIFVACKCLKFSFIKFGKLIIWW